jgi:NAD(P)-dependent dehydrogenase (short-subunit alcohol dehydrogenase family)
VRLENLMSTTAQTRFNDPDRWEELLPANPPPGEPIDIANMVAFLASDCAKNFSGTVITVDGGSAAA